MRLQRLGWIGWMALLVTSGPGATPTLGQEAKMTHGPMLGHVRSSNIRLWARTSKPAKLSFRYGLSKLAKDRISDTTVTGYAQDLTAHVVLTGLEPATLYHYVAVVDGKPQEPGGTFRTLPDTQALRDPKHNPRGLFNFSFEFACGNNQDPKAGLGPSLPTYDTLLRQVKKQGEFRHPQRRLAL